MQQNQHKIRLLRKKTIVLFNKFIFTFLFIFSPIGQSYSQELIPKNTLNFEINHIDINYTKPVYITIPFPNHYFFENEKLSLLWENSPIPFSAHAHLYWPSLTDGNRAVRAITIKLPVGVNGQYSLTWNPEIGKSLVSHSLSSNTFQAVQFSTHWLSKLSYGALLPLNQKHELHWFDEAFQRYGSYIIDEEELKKTLKKTYSKSTPGPWLYDKVFSLYLLYLKTGDLKWKNEAHQAALFYINNINHNGYFKLKPKDMKYLYGTGLLYDYMFFPDSQILSIINKMYRNTLDWPALYSMKKSFWTERHLSNALNMALTQWEMRQSTQALERINDITHGIELALKKSSNAPKGCLAHTYSQHQKRKDDVLVCSPWMTALLTEQLWRYYSLTGNQLAANIMMSFSDFVQEKAIYSGTVTHLKGLSIPDYLVYFGTSIYKEREPWADTQHACDISGMLAKGIYLKKIHKVDYHQLNNSFIKLLKTCKKTAYQSSNKTTFWKLRPLRKFNWWFSSTANLSWLFTEINNN